MTTAYYVHHHGRGHWKRFEAIRAASSARLIAVSELTEADVVLPSDVPDRGCDRTAATGCSVLHWAPTGPEPLRSRTRAFVDALDEHDVRSVVVDVSVEAALQARLAGIAPWVVRQHGDRTDRAHRNAYDVATGLIAPFPADLEHRTTPNEIRDRTTYVGFVVAPAEDVATPRSRPDDVVVLWGAGGGAPDGEWVDELASFATGSVHVLGASPRATRSNVTVHGWVERPESFLVARPTVVTPCGNNTVTLAGRWACPLVVVPSPRPFAEQERHAERLVELGLAVDGRRSDWRSVLTAAEATGDRWLAFSDRFDGASMAAALIGTDRAESE